MLKFLRISVLPLASVVLTLASCRDVSMPGSSAPTPIYAPMNEPQSEAIFSATSEVRALNWDGKTLWAATAGGVTRWNGSRFDKWTRSDGLPSNETFDLERDQGKLFTRFSTVRASWDGAKWQTQTVPEWKRRAPSVEWNGRLASANIDSLQIGKAKFPLPAQAQGTHISALLARGKTLLVGVYGDGLWRFDGTDWTRGPVMPDEAKEVLSLAGDDKKLWLGTRRNGIFERMGDSWKQLKLDDELWSHNVQNLAKFGGVLWGSTLDDGLIARTGKGFRHVTMPRISSSAPRQLLSWRNKLYVRHGGGIVDAFDGASWERDALKSIPRRGVYALASDNKQLLAAGWSGWSEWDGQSWTSHYDLPALKGVPIMNIAVQGDDVWLGTQSRGLVKWTRATGELRFYDERDGLNDDWITALCVDGNRVWAGTFVGGLTVFENGKWRAFDETKGANVTAIELDKNGGVWATTRHGLFYARGESAEKTSESWLDEEQQALCADENGLWIGARTSLNYLSTRPKP